jgi:hypothetical protein
MAKMVYNRAGETSDEAKIRMFYKDRMFYEVCPPFRMLLFSLCVAQYERCLRETNRGSSMRAGRVDMYMATYLPYCDQFVSNDERQLRCFQAIATEGSVDVLVRTYDHFRQSLVVAL